MLSRQLFSRPPKHGLLSGRRRLLKPYDRSGLGSRGSARTVFTARKDPQQLSPFLAAFAKRLLVRAFVDHFAGFADSTLRPCPFGAHRCGRARWVLNAAVVPVGRSKKEEMHIMNASATFRRMSGAKKQAGLLGSRWVRQSEYTSKGSSSIAK